MLPDARGLSFRGAGGAGELQRDYRNNVTLEQQLSEKQAKIESLQVECKKRGQLLVEKERTMGFFGRDLHQLVAHTETAAWQEGVRARYR